MKKSVWISMIVAAALVLAGIACIAVGHALGGHTFLTQGEESMGKTVQITHHEDRDFDRIRIDVLSADVELIPSEDGRCRIVTKDHEKVEYLVFVEGDTLTIRTEDSRHWYDHIGIFGGSKASLTVYLPVKSYESLTMDVSTGDVTVGHDFSFSEAVTVSVTVGDVSLSASVQGTTTLSATTGDLCVEGSHKALTASVTTGCVTVGSGAVETLSVKSGSGDVIIRDLTAEGAVCVETTTGDQSLLRVTCGRLDLRAGTGDVTLTDTVAAGHLRTKSTTGDVTFTRFDAATLSVETNTGSVRGSLRTPKVFYADTTSGSVDVPKSTEGGICEIKTTSGSIRIIVEE